MFFRVLSDVHSEFSPLVFPHLPTDKEDVLILAGDIAVADSANTYETVKHWIPRFRHTIYVCGNHEFYHGSYRNRTKEKLREIFVDLLQPSPLTIAQPFLPGKISLLDDESVIIDNVTFIGSTLWTSYFNHSPTHMYAAQQGLNDFRLIRTGPDTYPYARRTVPMDFYNAHKISADFIFTKIIEEKAAGQKVVVVTHHAPSSRSIHPQYRGQILNACYVSDLDEQIMDTKPEIFVHGHVHNSFDYMIGDTRVITNPRGYQHPNAEFPENTQFDPLMRVEIKSYTSK